MRSANHRTVLGTLLLEGVCNRIHLRVSSDILGGLVGASIRAYGCRQFVQGGFVLLHDALPSHDQSPSLLVRVYLFNSPTDDLSVGRIGHFSFLLDLLG